MRKIAKDGRKKERAADEKSDSKRKKCSEPNIIVLFTFTQVDVSKVILYAPLREKYGGIYTKLHIQ